MKKLQRDFTTPEQSKRLLELGVPADSANHYYGKDGKIHYIDGKIPCSLLWADGLVPCWSVGRLMEICLKCSTLEQRQVRFFCNGDDDEYSIIDYVLTVLESGVMTDHMDFSKLEN